VWEIHSVYAIDVCNKRSIANRVDALVVADGRPQDVGQTGRLATLTIIEIGSNQDLGADEVSAETEGQKREVRWPIGGRRSGEQGKPLFRMAADNSIADRCRPTRPAPCDQD
jgi:hypothetical protein